MTPAAPPARRALFFGLCLVALLIPGCRGCDDGLTPQERAAQQKAAEEQKKKEEEEERKKAPMVVGPVRLEPSQSDQPLLYVKPGHWTMVSQEMKRNYDDWVGGLAESVVDGRGQPVPLKSTPFWLRSGRPIALSKGQSKDVQSVFFPPPVAGRLDLKWAIQGRDAIDVLPALTEPFTLMLPHQYHFVVLAANPASYGKLGTLRSVDAPLHFEVDLQAQAGAWAARRQYRVVAPELTDRAPLPDSIQCLTSIAYVLWDEVDPAIFDPAQRDALVDWLHWGGQLVISGPDSLALLRDSFLAPYLPATAGDAWQITEEDLRPMVDAWGVGKVGPPLKLPRPWSGVRLELVEDTAERRASASPVRRATAQLRCGGLFAERRVGRGRVIVSAMQLNERGLQNWQNGYESLINAVVLRRPPRRFRNDNYASGGVYTEEDYTVGGGGDDDSTLAVEWADEPRVRIDAATNTAFRMLSRDSYHGAPPWQFTEQSQQFDGQTSPWGGQFPGEPITALAPPDYPGGAGGWDDFNAVSDAARQSLRKAAGVTVPDSGFVLACIGFYLLVLAPFNWMVFRTLGRVELAWVAAPLIAIAGTVVVVRLAQLDIGFVRAQTQIALLETQPNYPRGSLTRFTGVYTSLGTNYDFTFDDPGAVAAPFSTGADFQLLSGQRLTQVDYDRQEKARLLGLRVSSSTTGMVHSEEMHDPGGVLRLGTSSAGTLQLENLSDKDLWHVAVAYRPTDPPTGRAAAAPPMLMGCWVGKLAAKQSIAVSFSPVPVTSERATERAAYQEQRGSERVGFGPVDETNLEPLWRVALDPNEFEPGEHRAVARIDGVLPGMTVEPRASQQAGATLWVAHLQYEIPPAPRPDVNAPVDFEKDDFADEE